MALQVVGIIAISMVIAVASLLFLLLAACGLLAVSGSLADIVATGAAAFFAFQLWKRGPGTSHDIAILLGGIFGSMIYLGVVRFAAQLILMRGLGG